MLQAGYCAAGGGWAPPPLAAAMASLMPFTRSACKAQQQGCVLQAAGSHTGPSVVIRGGGATAASGAAAQGRAAAGQQRRGCPPGDSSAQRAHQVGHGARLNLAPNGGTLVADLKGPSGQQVLPHRVACRGQGAGGGGGGCGAGGQAIRAGAP